MRLAAFICNILAIVSNMFMGHYLAMAGVTADNPYWSCVYGSFLVVLLSIGCGCFITGCQVRRMNDAEVAQEE